MYQYLIFCIFQLNGPRWTLDMLVMLTLTCLVRAGDQYRSGGSGGPGGRRGTGGPRQQREQRQRPRPAAHTQPNVDQTNVDQTNVDQTQNTDAKRLTNGTEAGDKETMVNGQ